MVISDNEGFEVVDAHGPGIIPQTRAKSRRVPNTKLPDFVKTPSPTQGTEINRVETSSVRSSRRDTSASPTKRKRTGRSTSISRARSSSPGEVDELEESSTRRYRKPSTSSSSPKDSKRSSPTKGKGKTADKETKPKKPSKASLERAKLEEVRKDKHFQKLDEATIKRIAKAHFERLYLIHRYREGDDLKEAFDVCGSKGNVYKVLIDRTVSCSCVDFSLRRQVCKHLLFVYLKVLRLDSHLPVFPKTRLSAEELEEVFDQALANPVAQAMANPELRDAWKKAVGYTSDDESESAPGSSATGTNNVPVGKRLLPEEGDVCGVCYEDLEPGCVEGLEFCLESCGRPIHTDCLETWFKTRGFAKTCIWCRSKWHDPYESRSQDPEKHKGYKIGVGRRGAVVDSSGRQLNLAAAAALHEPEKDECDDVLPDVTDVPTANDPEVVSGWE